MSAASQQPPSSSSPSVIEVKDVTFRYFESPGGIYDINLSVAAGDRIVVLGRNGSGKSTLLSLLGGKRCPDRGTVRVLDRDSFRDTSLNNDIALIGPPWPPEAYFGNTVQAIASPAPDLPVRDAVATTLHLPLEAWVDKMSSGEKRRVQLLFGLMHPTRRIILMDECSTDLDIVERRNVMEIVRQRCESIGAACVYATHILDGIDEWATRVVVMEAGRIVLDEPMSQVMTAAQHSAAETSSSGATASDATADSLALRRANHLMHKAYRLLTHDAVIPRFAFAAPASDVVAVNADGFELGTILRGVDFSVPKGSRVLLVGTNGSGKSTLLDCIAGRRFFPMPKKPAATAAAADGQPVAVPPKSKLVNIFGRPCFHDTKLPGEVVLCGAWWSKAPEGQMSVGELLHPPLTERAERIRSLLKVDLTFDLRYVSSGELKRIQLLLGLQEERSVLLLDEATSDLDLDMRHVLLSFLYEESVKSGTTIIYATHIFEGLDGWSTHFVLMDRTTGTAATVIPTGDAEDVANLVAHIARLKATEPFQLKK